MTFTFLSDLKPREKHSVICVRVARKWEFRGPADNEPIQHVDLVLADEKGNVVYAEIPAPEIQKHDSKIQENGTYIISRFKVTSPRKSYRPVHTPHMIEFTCYTEIRTPKNAPTTFPRYVYTITEFNDLYNHVGDKTYFLDVLALIVEVAEPVWKRLGNQLDPALTRDVILQDINTAAELKLTLWGSRASEFNIDIAYNANDAKPLVTLFVGCLMKTFMGEHYLSGSSACKWYFNPEIPEATILLDRLQGERIEIRRVGTPLEQQVQPPPPAELQSKYLQELLDMHPYDFPENGCRCTVTIARIIPEFGYWYPACNICNKASIPEASGYRCRLCNCTGYNYRHKLSFIATDGTAEAEMICFGNIAGRIIGKSVEFIMQSIRRGGNMPPDIAAIISHKFTFIIKPTEESYHTPKKSYLVTTVIDAHGKQRVIPQVSATQGSSSQGPNNELLTQQTITTPRLLISRTAAPVHVSPGTPYTIETTSKDAPAPELDTPEKGSTCKRLYLNETDDNQEKNNDTPTKKIQAG